MKNKIKLTLKICGGIIGTFCASILFLAQMNTTTYYHNKFNDHSHFFRDIIKENPNFVNVNLTKICMLRSHDSLSDKISIDSMPNSSQKNLVNERWVQILGKGVSVRLSKAQNEDIYDQLKAGVRAIDARITNVNGVFYNSHGWISEPFENNLLSILKFLDENPGEFILFDVFHYFKGNSSWNELETFMRSVKYKGKSIFDYDRTIDSDKPLRFEEMAYSDIASSSLAGAVVFASDYEKEAAGTAFVKHGGTDNYITDHIDSMDSEVMFQKMLEYKDKYIREEKVGKCLIINQIQTTPNAKYILKTLFSYGLIEKAYQHNRYIANKKELDELFDVMPIFSCDYSTSNNNGFNDDIIALMTKKNIAFK